MTGCHIYSCKLSDCIWHCFFDPRPDFMVPKASSKVKVVAVLRLPKRGPKNGTPFLEPVESANTQEPQKKRVRNPDPILARFSRNFAPSPTNRWKTSLGKFTTSCADFEPAGAADQRAGNNEKQQRNRAVCITPTSKQGLPALWRPFVRRQRFRALFNPQNRPCIWVVVATLS